MREIIPVEEMRARTEQVQREVALVAIDEHKAQGYVVVEIADGHPVIKELLTAGYDVQPLGLTRIRISW
jgi:hypothetical protein